MLKLVKQLDDLFRHHPNLSHVVHSVRSSFLAHNKLIFSLLSTFFPSNLVFSCLIVLREKNR